MEATDAIAARGPAAMGVMRPKAATIAIVVVVKETIFADFC